MKRQLQFIIFAIVLLWLSTAGALDVPQLTGYVNDYAGMISPSVKASLEDELKAFEQSDSTQIVILTIPSLKNEVLEEYSIKVAEKWKIGQKGKDNGIIVLVAKQERKIRIEVGRGLEGRLTDLMAGRIIDLVIKPRFKRGDFDGGFTAGIHSLIDATRGEFKVEEKRKAGGNDKFSGFFAFLFFNAIIVFIIGGISRILGGIVGAICLPLLVELFFHPGLIAVIVLGIIGFVAGYFLSTLSFAARRSGSGGFDESYTGGGFSSGGGFNGFSGGGGGFGGGGASGDW